MSEFRVVIVGGGLAGLAAAAALVDRGVQVTLLEARRKLGGRAGSYLDRETGELVDHCQHVAMGCCTNYLDFCRRTGIEELFQRYDRLHFFGPDGQRSDFAPSSWLPAPLHLLPALRGLRFLSPASRRAIARGVLQLTKPAPTEDSASPTMLAWLEAQSQPAEAVERFWAVVLVSALGDTLDRVSVAAAQKVFVDGFLAAREASHILVPTVPLGELYDRRVADWLRQRGVDLRLETVVDEVAFEAGRVAGVRLGNGETLAGDCVVLAVPWRRVGSLVPAKERAGMPQLEAAARIKPSPITGVHLWFDRPIGDLPHAVIVGRLSQWVFSRQGSDAHYYQVVISGSHDLSGRERGSILGEVLGDMATIWPQSREATLIRSRIITDHESVFSMQPGVEALRPPQQTALPGLALAGDWTRTGWPATMEGAVRSGHLAAEVVLKHFGRAEQVAVSELPRGWLARLVLPAP